MGRPSLSAEAIAANKISIISAAIEMIRESGIDSVTARSLGSRIGMNSALIYRYFRDIDEVILFACVHALQDYSAAMNDAFHGFESVEDISDSEIYMTSWELFCRHAFSAPDEYRILFFSRHSAALGDIIHEYYELFPPKNSDLDDMILRGMYRTSDLRKRNLLLLIPVLESKKSEQDIIMLNDMTIAYFHALLLQLVEKEHDTDPELQTERMLRACRYTIAQ